MRSHGVVATAGNLGILHRCEVGGDNTSAAFPQMGLYDSDGNLTRTIEFDEDRLDDALAELAEVTGEPVRLLDPPST